MPRRFTLLDVPHLLVTKLTRRGDKAKDLVDVTELLAAAAGRSLEIDFALVRELLAGRPEALALLDDVEPGPQDPSEAT